MADNIISYYQPKMYILQVKIILGKKSIMVIVAFL